MNNNPIFKSILSSQELFFVNASDDIRTDFLLNPYEGSFVEPTVLMETFSPFSCKNTKDSNTKDSKEYSLLSLLWTLKNNLEEAKTIKAIYPLDPNSCGMRDGEFISTGNPCAGLDKDSLFYIYKIEKGHNDLHDYGVNGIAPLRIFEVCVNTLFSCNWGVIKSNSLDISEKRLNSPLPTKIVNGLLDLLNFFYGSNENNGHISEKEAFVAFPSFHSYKEGLKQSYSLYRTSFNSINYIFGHVYNDYYADDTVLHYGSMCGLSVDKNGRMKPIFPFIQCVNSNDPTLVWTDVGLGGCKFYVDCQSVDTTYYIYRKEDLRNYYKFICSLFEKKFFNCTDNNYVVKINC